MTEVEWIAFLQRPAIPAFNRAMLERPDDDLPRLVFADWMDENCPDADVNRAVRESIVTRETQDIWSAGQRRGFGVASLTLTRGRFAVGIETRTRHPAGRSIWTVLDALWCAEWGDTAAFGNEVSGARLVRWFRDPHMAAVSSVALVRCDLTAEHFRKMLASAHLVHLRGIAWTRYHARDPSGSVRVLAESPILAQLESLELGVSLDADALRALVSSPHLKRLQILRLKWCLPQQGGAEVLAGSPRLSTLTTLDLDSRYMSPVAAVVLANSPYLCETIRAQWRRPTDEGGANR